MNQDRMSDYLDQIQQAVTLALSYVEGMSKADFMTDTRTQQAVIMNLLIIGEIATKLLSDYADFVEQHPAVPWRGMKGMRNRIVHGYFDINLDVVWETLKISLRLCQANYRK